MEANSQGSGVALVTGGARRIGSAIALALAGDGWDVAVHFGRSAADASETVRAIEALGGPGEMQGAAGTRQSVPKHARSAAVRQDGKIRH